MKNKIIIFAVLIMASVFLIIANTKSTDRYTLKTFKVENGWGYTILHKDKVFIKQDVIPGIPDKKPFATKKDAVIVGKLVIEKLKNKKMPSISYKELQVSGVSL